LINRKKREKEEGELRMVTSSLSWSWRSWMDW